MAGKKDTNRRGNFEFTDVVLEEIRILSHRGLNQTHVCGWYGFSNTTWKRHCKKNPKIMESYNAGKSKGVSFAASKLMELIKAGNLEAIKFYLARVGKFTEAPEIQEDEENGPKPATITFTVTDPVQAAKTYQQIIQGSTKNE